MAYFEKVAGRAVSATELAQVAASVLAAYRYQYIVSGVTSPRFGKILFSKLSDAQKTRVAKALEPLLATVASRDAQS